MVIVGIVIAIVVTIFLCVLFFKSRKGNLTKPTAAKDPQAQALYNQSKNKKEEQQLSLKEKLELSWKFLYEITETVMNKFSTEDRAQVNEIGQSLTKHGMKYEHVIDLGIRPIIAHVQNVEVEQQKSAPEGRAR